MTYWTTPADVTARWVGNDVPTDEDLVAQLLEDAEAVILAEYPRIQERIDGGSLDLSVVKMVVSRMVMRVLRNPEALTYWQQTTGPFGQARNFGAGNSDIWLTDNERQLIAPRRNGKAYNFNIAPDMVAPAPVDSDGSIWRSVE